jgi:esterase/lipase
VREGYSVLSGISRRICVVGFSTGGALALLHAAGGPAGLAGVVSIAAPLRYGNRAMMFVPLVHGANQLVRWVSAWEGVVPFRENDSENPHINYRHMPIRGLYELRRLSEELQQRLGEIQCPVLVLQGDRDPVVDPRSAEILRAGLPPATTTIRMVASARHGILYRDIDHTQAHVEEFAATLAGAPVPVAPALLPAPT